MFSRAYEAKLLEPFRIHRLTPFLRISAELPVEGDAEPAVILYSGFQIHTTIINFRGNFAGLEDVGAKDIQ